MKSIQLTVDESLLAEEQQATGVLQNAEGYAKHPQCSEEIEEWESEQDWGEDQKRIDALWTREAELRDKEIEDGIVKAIPGEEVMNRLRSRYKR